jgi:CHAT domain-containing protein
MDLMTAFYEQWLAGKGKREAFKEARRRLRAKYPEPYFWAAFVMMD